MISFQIRDKCNAEITSFARLFRQLRAFWTIGSLLPSGHPLIHSALLNTPEESWSPESSVSETGSIMVSVRSFEKKTLAYGSAVVLSTTSSNQSLHGDHSASHTITAHSVDRILTQALIIIIIIIVIIVFIVMVSIITIIIAIIIFAIIVTRILGLPSAPSSDPVSSH